MGGWFQNVGVRSLDLPPDLSRRSSSDPAWLPEPPAPGWSWLTLDEMVDQQGLDELVGQSAKEAAAPALGYAVFDEDSTYLVAAGPDGVESRLVFAPETFDLEFARRGPTAAQLSTGGAEAFAAWSSKSAPATVEAASVRAHCEDPDPLALLEAIGLYPPPTTEPDDAWSAWYPSDLFSAAPWDWNAPVTGSRHYSILPEPADQVEGPPGPWILFVTHRRDPLYESIDPDYEGPRAYLTFLSRNVVFGLDRDEASGSVEAEIARFDGGYYGRAVGDWQQVPEQVGSTMADTVAWLMDEARAPGSAASSGPR
jgi:hypothetical protein